MIALFRNILSLFKLGNLLPEKTTPNIPQELNSILPITTSPTTREEAIQMFKVIGALTLMRQALSDQEKFYQDLYTKEAKKLSDNPTWSSKKTSQDIHYMVNIYNENLSLIAKEIRSVDELIHKYTTTMLKQYLKLNTKYDKSIK